MVGRMRVLTMNIFARHRGWTDRRQVLVAGLRDLSPDVVAFQESIKTHSYDQVVDLLGPNYHVLHQVGRSEDGVGASIASRWPFDVVREVDLHVAGGGDPTDWIGSLVLVQIDVPEPIGPVLLAHHKPTWQSNMERVRELQTHRLHLRPLRDQGVHARHRRLRACLRRTGRWHLGE